MSSPEEFLADRKKARWWIAGAIAGVGGGVGVIAFLAATFAPAKSVSAIEQRTTKLEAHAAKTDDRQTKVETKVDELLEERDFNRAQLWELARATGARQVPPPARK